MFTIENSGVSYARNFVIEQATGKYLLSMVANVFIFIAKVIETKRIRDKNFVLVDGSVHNIKPTMHKKNLPMSIIRQYESQGKTSEIFNIVGYTCMEKDYLAHDIVAEIPDKNDYILFENVFNPPFIKERPSIIAADNKEIFEVRRKETVRQFFNEEIYYF
jgi:diaminopimelate decarboxylase